MLHHSLPVQYMNPIIFFRVSWLDGYKGADDDLFVASLSTPAEDYSGFDTYNFLPTVTAAMPTPMYYIDHAGIHYGKLKLQRIGIPLEVLKADNVCIVLVGTNPFDGQQYVVGWYRQASIYLKTQEGEDIDGNHMQYQAMAPVGKSSRLLPMKNRTFKVKFGEGSDLWTSATITNRELLDLWNYINQFPS